MRKIILQQGFCLLRAHTTTMAVVAKDIVGKMQKDYIGQVQKTAIVALVIYFIAVAITMLLSL